MRRSFREGEWNAWGKPLESRFRDAELLAYKGRIAESIEAAEESQIKEYGDMHGIEFRCVTKTTTVTTNVPLRDGWTCVS